ncbi:MAG: glycosyltransferase [Flavobacteriales bacterium]|jgi:glycosyltransferase involved in cell wall biosynthesis|nr:glycosyltransferase [Flavobacteriales bacterium]
MDTKKISIGYGGWLQYYEPGIEQQTKNWLTTTFLNYRIDNVNHHVRSAYYIYKALQLLKQMGKEEMVKLHLWGNIDSRNQTLSKKMNIDSMVEIGGKLSKKDNLEKLNSMDILFLPLELGKNDCRSLFIPGKVYEYLFLEKPILAVGGDSDAKNLILDSGLGFHFDPENPEDIVKFLIKTFNDRSNLRLEPNKELIASKSFDVLTGELVTVFNSL